MRQDEEVVPSTLGTHFLALVRYRFSRSLQKKPYTDSGALYFIKVIEECSTLSKGQLTTSYNPYSTEGSTIPGRALQDLEATYSALRNTAFIHILGDKKHLPGLAAAWSRRGLCNGLGCSIPVIHCSAGRVSSGKRCSVDLVEGSSGRNTM